MADRDLVDAALPVELPDDFLFRTETGIVTYAELKARRETQEQRARRLFDEMARNIGREAVNHLKTMYPDALKAVSKSAEISLTNHIRNDINWRMRPLLMAMIAMHREGEREA